MRWTQFVGESCFSLSTLRTLSYGTLPTRHSLASITPSGMHTDKPGRDRHILEAGIFACEGAVPQLETRPIIHFVTVRSPFPPRPASETDAACRIGTLPTSTCPSTAVYSVSSRPIRCRASPRTLGTACIRHPPRGPQAHKPLRCAWWALGTHGASLSVGQKQRLAIAYAPPQPDCPYSRVARAAA